MSLCSNLSKDDCSNRKPENIKLEAPNPGPGSTFLVAHLGIRGGSL